MDSVKHNVNKILLSKSLEIVLKLLVNVMMYHRSVVGTRTSHGLGGPGFEFRQWQAISCSPKQSRPALVPTGTPMGTGVFSWR
jgi:hypothetical protein